MTYDFSTLDPVEFENLACDLLSRELNVSLESFKIGRDKGIDSRHVSLSGFETIIQCKHYLKSGFISLKTKLRHEELLKIKILNPSRYILVTSVPLSPMDKEELQSILGEYCKTPNDIVGAHELNFFLRKFPDVEKLHYKLWLASTSVLERLVNCRFFASKYITEETIKRKISLFVEPENVIINSLRILDEHKTLVISGPPGIGKTTLAEILISKYVSTGYEVVPISYDLEEALSVPHHDKKIIFFYDDFLGQVDLLNKNEDNRILNLIRHLEGQTKKKFILTTREYLLKEAQNKFEKLNAPEFSTTKMVLELNSYTKNIKAKILYKHLLHFGVENAYLDDILFTYKIQAILEHPNFNPRIIETVCKEYKRSSVQPIGFAKAFIDTLNQPDLIWAHIFDRQIDFAGQSLLYIACTFGHIVELEALEVAFNRFYQEMRKEYNVASRPNEFLTVLKVLEGTFLKLEKDYFKNTIVSFVNPSVREFVFRRLISSQQVFDIAWNSTCSYEQHVELFKNSHKRNGANSLFLLSPRYFTVMIRSFDVNNYINLKSHPYPSTKSVVQGLETVCDFYNMLPSPKDFQRLELLGLIQHLQKTNQLRGLEVNNDIAILLTRKKIISTTEPNYSADGSRDILRSFASIIMVEPSTLDETNIIIDFCRYFPMFLGEELFENIKVVVQDFAHVEVSGAIRDGDYDLEGLRSFQDEVIGIASWFSLDKYELGYEDIYEKIRELEAQEDYDDHMREMYPNPLVSKETSGSGHDSYEDILSQFMTLKDK